MRRVFASGNVSTLRIVPSLFLLIALAIASASPALAQQFIGQIDLDDGDPGNIPDSPFGATVTPDGRFVLVCVSGDPDFDPPNPPDLNNREVRVIDRATDTVVNVITVGLFPVACDITVDGTDNYLWVCNSSDGNVSVFQVENGDFDDPGSITEAVFSPVSTGAFSFPGGIAADAANERVWVGTGGGTGEVFSIDADPQSGTFGAIVDTALLQGGSSTGRLAIYDEYLVVPHAVFAFPLSDGRATIIDTGNTNDKVEIFLTPTLDFNQGEFVSTIDVAVTDDGFAYLTLLGPGTGQNVIVLDVPNRMFDRAIFLAGADTEDQHGIGISPDSGLAAVTNFGSQKIVFLDLDDDSIVSVLDSPNDEPNEVVWALDSCTAYVTNQNTNGGTSNSIGIIGRFDDRELSLTGTSSPAIGGEIELFIQGGCEGRKGGILESEALGSGTFRGIPVPLANPVRVAEGGRYDVRGEITAQPIQVPIDPSLIGTSMHYVAGAQDQGGAIRLSNVHTVIFQP